MRPTTTKHNGTAHYAHAQKHAHEPPRDLGYDIPEPTEGDLADRMSPEERRLQRWILAGIVAVFALASIGGAVVGAGVVWLVARIIGA